MKNERKNMMAMVAMMAICAVLVTIGIAGIREIMGKEPGIVMIMVMDMHANRIHISMPMKPERHRPGGLERDDEHDEQGNETAHAANSTELIVSTKCMFILSGRDDIHMLQGGVDEALDVRELRGACLTVAQKSARVLAQRTYEALFALICFTFARYLNSP